MKKATKLKIKKLTKQKLTEQVKALNKQSAELLEQICVLDKSAGKLEAKRFAIGAKVNDLNFKIATLAQL